MADRGRIASGVCSELKWLIDHYIIDFYVDEYWKKVPSSWEILDRLSDQEWSRVMDEQTQLSLSIPLPLSLICLRSLLSAFSLVNRNCRESLKEVNIDYDRVREYQSLTVYEKRKVKEKKRGEIERVVPLLRAIRDARPFSSFVDIGSGLGHLTRAIVSSIPLLCVRGVEGSEELVERAMELDEKRKEKRVARMRVWVDGESKELLGDDQAVCVGGLHACGDLSPSIIRLALSQSTVSACLLFGCCFHKLNGGRDKLFRQEWEGMEEGKRRENGFPMSEQMKGERLSYAARELACHSKSAYVKQLREKGVNHGHHGVRAMGELLISRVGGGRHLGLRGVSMERMGRSEDVMKWIDRAMVDHPLLRDTIKEKLSHGCPSLPPVDSIPSLISSFSSTLTTLYNLRLMVAPFVEDLILIDRVAAMRESGMTSTVVRLFDPVISPRCFALIGLR
ncbi:hypothetical protein PMAYCL1PPCAC_02533 [Pristionchus mayeri]|uniref:Methyltransferase domain-containing protein n=1 Tax=Pristionchus mayeri TaxID=1317129 RepID=A0AAN4Z5J3_9BILA|nr:hypothetical protein PMAYCL1PPCAC_02533 [Pristionchus mayeri]